jgi:hypothetical protein
VVYAAAGLATHPELGKRLLQELSATTQAGYYTDYSAFPLSHDQASWYKAMKHYRNNFGNGRCLSGFYDSAHKTAVLYLNTAPLRISP